MVGGPVLTTSQVYAWARSGRAPRFGQWERYCWRLLTGFARCRRTGRGCGGSETPGADGLSATDGNNM